MITQTAKYAIKTLYYLAQQQTDRYFQTKDVADKLGIPANYLGKTLQKLARARILESQKGLHGGFRCERHPGKVTLYELLRAVDAFPETVGVHCDDDLPAAFHERFTVVQQAYERFLHETTIQDLLTSKSGIPAGGTQGAGGIAASLVAS